MATVPTLTVGGIDQTAFIHNKTLSMRLQSLDFTLVDPATTPDLHDVVSVDDPEWHGRVSTIESYPMRTASGDDHRWVKITCTNKHVALTATTPFALSDAPNYTTTFPYKDFGYIQTLADQTDLATAEHRAVGIVYEPGLLPGMIVDVTSAAEGLTAYGFYITEMTVEWLRDDVPFYRLELSAENDPPVTLGGLIENANCDCAPFEPCPEPDFTVHSFQDADVLACVFPDHANGQTCESTDFMRVYRGATYKVEYNVYHAPDSNCLSVSLAVVGGAGLGTAGPLIGVCGSGPPAVYMGDLARHCMLDPTPDDVPYGICNFTVDPGVGDYINVTTIMTECGCTAGDSFASSVSTHITWLEGPDPRFESLGPCEETPLPGQPIAPEEFSGDGTTDTFTLVWPYMPGSIYVVVEGVDWSDQVIESDPTNGDFALAYPPPTPTDAEANIEVYYRYPRV